MTALCQKPEHVVSRVIYSEIDCDFNRSMQHLVSKNREEDVADEEVPTEDSLHRSRQEHDVGSLAERRFFRVDCAILKNAAE